MNGFTINKTIFIKTSVGDVFDALTSSDKIVQYFPLKKVISNWKLGSEVLYKGEIEGNEFTDYGTITELTAPTKYSYSYWSDNHGTERTPENHLIISYTLTSINNGTQLELQQLNIKSEELFNIMNTVVWDSLLSSLKNYMENVT
jgi:uncharacterized protein YndB with AHSA1/START domain